MRKTSTFGAVLAAATVVAGVLAYTADAAPASPFTVANGTIRPATGTPAPPSGTQASLWSNHSTATITLDGAGRVVVGAIGDDCDGWPTLRATVDGTVVGSTAITSASQYGAYAVGSAVGAGHHTVVFAFTNDHRTAACDRNVHLATARLETAGRRPGADTTGVPPGTRLTVHEGDLTVSTPGTVIDGLDVHGRILVKADDVTVRRTFVRGGKAPGPNVKALVSAWFGAKNFVIEDSTLKSQYPSAWQNGLQGYNFTARRLDVSNVVDNALIQGDDASILDSWFHDTTWYSPHPQQPDNQTHNDNLQIEGGHHLLVQANFFEEAANTSIMITQNAGQTADVQVVGNWFHGGGACNINMAEKGGGPILGFHLHHNRFGVPRLGKCAVLVPRTSQVTLDGDVWDATGEPVAILPRD